MGNEKDFENMTDDEVLDGILKAVMDPDVKDSIPRVSDTVDKERVVDVLKAYAIAQELFKNDTSVNIELKLHEPFRTTGVVSITGKNIVFDNPIGFMQIVDLATNFEAYALTNGKTKIAFTFLGLMKLEEGKK